MPESMVGELESLDGEELCSDCIDIVESEYNELNFIFQSPNGEYHYDTHLPNEGDIYVYQGERYWLGEKKVEAGTLLLVEQYSTNDLYCVINGCMGGVRGLTTDEDWEFIGTLGDNENKIELDDQGATNVQ